MGKSGVSPTLQNPVEAAPQLLVDSVHPWIPAADAGDPVDAGGVLLTTLPPAGEPTILDVAPTVLSLMGVDPPAACVGQSFW